MKTQRILAATATAAAIAMALSACGSSGSSEGTGGGSGSGGGTIASKLILGGSPELKNRPDGLPGLKKNYGLTFQGYKVLDVGGPITVTALKNGQVDAADVFTTDPALKANHFVTLTDPKNNFGAQNVLPLIRKDKATAGVKQVLNFISSKLTTNDLINLRTKVEVDKQDPDAAAKAYLQSIKPPTTTPASGVSLTIASANFPENIVIADIYADALSAAGAKVTKKLNIGTRDKYLAAMTDGTIDLVPEYSGVLLQFYDKKAAVSSSEGILKALPGVLPASLMVLNESSAEDRDAIVVTAATAKKYNLTSIADLAKKAP